MHGTSPGNSNAVETWALTMATDTNDKVQEGADATDVDFNEVAAGLGISLKADSEKAESGNAEKLKPEDTEEKQTDEADEPEGEGGEDEEKLKSENAEKLKSEAGETEETPESEGDEGEEETAEPEPSKVQKRIDRITAEKHELREQLDAIKAELEETKAKAEAQPPVIFKDPENPLSSFTDAAALEAEIAKAQAVLDWTEDNRDGATVTVNGEEKFYDSDAVKQIRANARNIVKAGPKQQEYLRVRSATLPEAKAFYPDFFKPGTSANQFLQATLKQYPSIVQFPNWELIVGDAFEGQRLRMARIEQMQKRASAGQTKKAPAKTAEAAKVPKAPVPNASPKVTNNSSAALRHKADAALKAKGDNRDALAAFMEEIV